MSRQPFFWRIFFLFAALQIATLLTFLVMFSKWQGQAIIRAEERRLHDSVVILRAHLRPVFESGDREQMQKIARSISDETQARVTLVAIDGIVFADSDEDPESMENHKNRPELLDAANSGFGVSQRFSNTIKQSMLYFAARLDSEKNGEPLGFIRCALPISELQAKADEVHSSMWLVAAGFSVVCLMITYLFVRRALAPVRTLTAAAQAMAKGDYQQNLGVSRKDELGELANSFNDMSSGIEAREAALRQSSARMSAVLSGMVEAVIAVDYDQRVMFANEAAGNIFEVELGDLQGAKMGSTIANEPLNEIIRNSLGNADEVENQYVEIEASNGVVLSVNAARLPGQPCPGIVLVMHDITELRRLEQLRQEFVANVSHELKTPLSAIIAYAETLDNGALEDPVNSRRFVHQIEEQAARLSDLIQDMLQLARIEAGQVLYEITRVQLFPEVETCVASLRDKAVAQNVTLTSQQQDTDVEVNANGKAIRQILDNLADNAIKYTPEGGHVHISWKRDGAFVMIQVEDDGLGIPAEHHERIFERFYRVDKARTRDMGGTGLGLSIVKHLAQTLGGSVTIESVEEQGTMFRVWLPSDQMTSSPQG